MSAKKTNWQTLPTMKHMYGMLFCKVLRFSRTRHGNSKRIPSAVTKGNLVIYAGTGHRPPHLSLGYDPESNRLLTEFVRDQLTRVEDVTHVISGGATGFDQALAHAASLLGIPYTLAEPHEGFGDHWPKDWQKRRDALRARAAKVVVVSPGRWETSEDNWKYLARDRYMIDQADAVLALYDGKPKKSGTGLTVCYATQKGKPVINWWEAWSAKPG